MRRALAIVATSASNAEEPPEGVRSLTTTRSPVTAPASNCSANPVTESMATRSESFSVNATPAFTGATSLWTMTAIFGKGSKSPTRSRPTTAAGE